MPTARGAAGVATDEAAKTVRIGAGMGFYGDTVRGALDTARHGDVRYICFDHLAELTLAILQKDRQKDPSLGYTKDIAAIARALLPVCAERGIRLVSNSGGLNPAGARDQVLAAARELGLRGLRVATVTGDDLLPRIDELRAAGVAVDLPERVLFANVYLGARPVAEALARGADVVITGRVADASLFLAPLLHEFGWAAGDWDRLAVGVTAGHLLECSAQCTGGNFSGDWWNIPDMDRIGYPIAEVTAEGDLVITKAPGTGGRVSPDTVKEQLLYEVHDPAAYANPDVMVDFTGIRLVHCGPDRVRVEGCRGRPAPSALKGLIGYTDGFLGVGMMGYAWPDALAKARRAEWIIRRQMADSGLAPEAVHVEYLGFNALHGPLADPAGAAELNEVFLRIAVRTRTREEAARLGRLFPPLSLNGPPFIGGLSGMLPVRELLGQKAVYIPRELVEPWVRVEVTEAT